VTKSAPAHPIFCPLRSIFRSAHFRSLCSAYDAWKLSATSTWFAAYTRVLHRPLSSTADDRVSVGYEKLEPEFHRRRRNRYQKHGFWRYRRPQIDETM